MADSTTDPNALTATSGATAGDTQAGVLQMLLQMLQQQSAGQGAAGQAPNASGLPSSTSNTSSLLPGLMADQPPANANTDASRLANLTADTGMPNGSNRPFGDQLQYSPSTGTTQVPMSMNDQAALQSYNNSVNTYALSNDFLQSLTQAKPAPAAPTGNPMNPTSTDPQLALNTGWNQQANPPKAATTEPVSPSTAVPDSLATTLSNTAGLKSYTPSAEAATPPQPRPAPVTTSTGPAQVITTPDQNAQTLASNDPAATTAMIANNSGPLTASSDLSAGNRSTDSVAIPSTTEKQPSAPTLPNAPAQASSAPSSGGISTQQLMNLRNAQQVQPPVYTAQQANQVNSDMAAGDPDPDSLYMDNSGAAIGGGSGGGAAGGMSGAGAGAAAGGIQGIASGIGQMFKGIQLPNVQPGGLPPLSNFQPPSMA
jgi:hypothetical protein